MTKRVLLAGIFHETHTFLGGRTPLSDFAERSGSQLLDAAGDGSPLAGALQVAKESGWEVLPLIDLRATPSATVDDEVIEHFCREFAERAAPELARGVDGIFLILHGAMVCESFPDVEGEILARIRRLPGADRLPIGGVFDLHANFSARMAELADCLVAYRENPHADACAAAMDAARLFDRLMRTGERPRTLWERPPLVWTPTGTGTASDPMRTLEAMARQAEAADPAILAINVVGGFSFADTPDTGVSFTAVTVGDEGQARTALEKLSQYAIAHREQGCPLDPPLESIMPKLAGHSAGPVLLVEPSDNIGGGAPGDGTAVLTALVAHGIQNAAVAINDPVAVAQLRGLRPGGRLTLPIGGRENAFTPPISLDVEFVSSSDGRFQLEDAQSHLASMCGTHFDMGPSVVVRHRGILILLTTRKTPPFDLAQWRSQGITPESLFVIGIKAAVAHRRAYDPITKASYTVDTPGPCSSNLRSLPFRQIRRPVFPLDAF